MLFIDFETRSELDLREVGLWNYSRHPSTDVWCMAYAFGDEEPGLWRSPHSESMRVRSWIESGKPVAAHNAPFELAIWNQIMVPRHGWPVLKPEQGVCTMAMAYAMGLPGALEDVAYALGLRFQKDTTGYNLMLRYARPWTRDPVKWMDENPRFSVAGVKYTGAEGLARLHEYCRQDVRVDREVHSRLMPLSEKERRVWLMDYAINQRGVQIDVEAAKGAVAMAEDVKVQLDREMAKVTGNVVQTCTAVQALKDWMAALGCEKESLAKQEVVDLLPTLEESANPNAGRIVRALKLRQEAAKASTAKFEVMVNQADEHGRLHNLYAYHGTGPGRWAGRQPQIHNLPRDMPKPEAVERILDLVRANDWRGIDMIYGAPLTAMSRCLRSFFTAPPGRVLVGGDWSNIEGRGQAWFANEEWKLNAFRAADAGTGPGLYELAYAKSFGVPVESVKNPSEERQIGKVMELAFGYGGGAGTFHVMGRTYGVKVPDMKAEEFKTLWRQAHPRISAIWREIENAARGAVANPGETYSCGWPGRQAHFKVVGSFLWLLLPSGRAICYPFPKLLPGTYGDQVTYMCVPSEEDRRKGKIIADPQNSGRWVRMGAWGGSFLNNTVQGFSRDFLAEGMLVLHDQGAALTVHTHDSLALEAKTENADAARREVGRVMNTAPAWAKDFPMYAKPHVELRYRG